MLESQWIKKAVVYPEGAEGVKVKLGQGVHLGVLGCGLESLPESGKMPQMALASILKLCPA